MAKRIAIVATPAKRKELIEWSYENKSKLKDHELIATPFAAGLLEGTVNKPVLQVPPEDVGGYHQMATLMQDQKVDVIFFFENPMRTFRPNDNLRHLLDTALEMNVVIAGNRSSLDAVLA